MSSPCASYVGICIESDIRYLDLVQEVSDNLTTLIGFDSDSQYWIGLAVREAVANAIQHGNKEDRKKRVELLFQGFEDRLRITVKDEGTGVIESIIPDPLDPENILKPGGRGIFFVRSFMDNVKFENHPEGGSELIMEKFCTGRLVPKQGENDDD